MKNSLSEFQVDILVRHNYYREKHHVPALSWNSFLAEKAYQLCKQYQSTIEENNSKSAVTISFNILCSIPDVGQNIHITTKYKTIRGYEVVDDWYGEYINYDYKKEKNVDTTNCFTQIVWKNTIHLGVATLLHKEKRITIALYSPEGNKPGQYAQNVINYIQPKISVSQSKLGLKTEKLKYDSCNDQQFLDLLINVVNRHRWNEKLPLLILSQNLNNKAIQLANNLINDWNDEMESPEISVKAGFNEGICIAIIPKNSLDAEWICEHWFFPASKLLSSRKYNLERHEESTTHPIFFSPYIEYIGTGIAIKSSLACVVCLFAPVEQPFKDVVFTKYEHIKCTIREINHKCD